jgi:AcrR family transcriptional regulator
MTDKLKPWIIQGYKVFARTGPRGLVIERIAKAVGKNKSSFYHHFADLEVFTNILLSHHLEQVHIAAEKEAQCQTLEELIQVTLDHGEDLLFSRQLRIHRDVPEFERCFQASNQVFIPAILGIWAEIIGLEEQSYLAGLVLQLSLDNFFLQITAETLNAAWLRAYFHDLRNLVHAFKTTGTLSPLNGPV